MGLRQARGRKDGGPRRPLTIGYRHTARLAWVLALGWFAWTAGGALARVLGYDAERPPARERPRIPERAKDVVTRGPREIVEALRAGGSWAFEGLPWGIAFRRVEDGAAVAALGPPGRLPTTGPVSLVERAHVELIKGMATDRVSSGPETTYTAVGPEYILRAVTTGTGAEERLAGVRLAYPSGANEWTALELQPRSEAAGASGPHPGEPSHILPLPSGVKRLVERRDGEGRRLVEVVALAETPSALPGEWSAAGWVVDGRLDAPTRGRPVVCRRGSETVRVFLSRRGPAQGWLLMLLAPPT
ncbi:MAG: hypothetical protein AB7I30_07715 [Isosphaeraceae bacterium]